MNTAEQHLIITAEDENQRLDQFLTQSDLSLTRSQIQKMILNNNILVNKKNIKPSYKIQNGDNIFVQMPPRKDPTLKPYDFPLDILFEDEELLVINKPANLVVHPAHGHENDTLVNALIHHYPNFQMGLNENRPGIVHRLDKDTSGALVVAKNHETQLHLASQFKEKTVHRTYWALCHGPFHINNKDRRHIYPHGNTPETFQIQSYLARHPNDRKRYSSQSINENKDYQTGKLAITNFKFKGILDNGLVFFHCKLETGRTHQIRIHISEMGCPIIGDQLYGKKRVNKTYGLKDLSRLGLHAAELGFVHPKTNEELFFKSEIPDELKSLFDKF
jgi:23S rRNA pseudouridine1911/1915/1917 synthase